MEIVVSDSDLIKNNPYNKITKRFDHIKIRHNQKEDIDVNIAPIKDLGSMCNRTNTHIRSGVIIYTKMNGKTYFCLGVDTQSGNLTDFGGGIKKDETIVEGGLRELIEESQGIFGDIKPGDIQDNIAYYSYNMVIMLIYVDNIDIIQNYNLFKEKLYRINNPEVCDIVWLEKDEFLESIHGRGKQLYIRVRKLLNKVTTDILNL